MITVAGLVAVTAMVVCVLVLYPQLRGELAIDDPGS
jgi:hypothetical protein